jgi:hypothetical protein
VNVEYNDILDEVSKQGEIIRYINGKLKLREDNTVIISPSKTYSHQELEAYLRIALNHPMRTEEEINDRIKEILG